jgi:tetratricopeptide (TPR) repeat protein/tRNA A-37 threonylcarbamoyl transferase component Bud32
MTSHQSLEALQGELERLFDLDEMLRLSADVLGFDPKRIGHTATKGAFARALVSHCADEEALEALVDAILFSSDRAEPGLRDRVKTLPNGELKPGTKVGAMKIVKKIGEGGLSMVYLVEGETEQGEIKRAALKVIRPQFARDKAAVHRFTTLARTMKSIDAPGLVPILEVGQLEDNRPWVVAEYLPGQTLADRIERTGSLHIHEARSIIKGVLDGLTALHKRGLVHGDLKAENVFVTRDETRGEPTGVLVDAGADRLLTRTGFGATVTGLLPIIGTAKAIAPEQARGLQPDARTDIYQAGTLIYEVLTGRPPFLGDSAIDVVAQHLSAQPAAPSSYARKGWISPSLDEVVLRALAKDPAERFQSARELSAALDHAASRPATTKVLDEGVFQNARMALRQAPSDDAAADRLEELARETGAWPRVAEAIREAAHATSDVEVKLGLLFRVARIYDNDLKETMRAEAVYQQIRELDPNSQVALRGIEGCKRSRGDHAGLIEVLLDRIEQEPAAVRKQLLHEVATLYEKQLRDTDNALIAWTQVLLADPRDTAAKKHVEQLAGNQDSRWAEVLETLSQSAQATQAELFTDEGAQRDAARASLAAAHANLQQVQAMIEASIAERSQQSADSEAEWGAQRREAEAQVDAVLEIETARENEAAAAAQMLSTHSEAAAQLKAEAEQARNTAEQTVEAYEQLAEEVGEAPSEAQAAELERLAGEAEGLVEHAEALEQQADAALAGIEQLREALALAQQAHEAAQADLFAAQAALDEVPELVGDDEAVQASPEERAMLAEAERELASAHASHTALEQRDGADAAAEREKSLADLAETYTLMGRFYGEQLRRPDFALSCFSQAISLDATHDGAYEGVVDLYRSAQSWPELATALTQRADRAKSSVKAREYRVEAATVLATKIGDIDQARSLLNGVLVEDPAHPQAQRALGEILSQQEDWPALAHAMEQELSALKGDSRQATLVRLAELYEDRLGEDEKAAAKYKEALELDARDLSALKGLERVYARTENYEGLLSSLRAQVDLAASPKQRIALHERIGLLLEEEFVDHSGAAKQFEEIIAIDGANEAANVALTRLYRHLRRFADMIETLERHAGSSNDDTRRIELLLLAARTLAADIGSPERAIEMYEGVLDIDNQQEEALTELAKLKSTVGDTAAAVDAVERLADQENDTKKQAQLYIQAGGLLRDHGDRDGAVSRFKRALDIDPEAMEAAEGLRDIYSQRGDARGAAEMIVHKIGLEQGGNKRAALLAELGTLYRDRMEDVEQAKDSFEQALELDTTCTVAGAGLARISHAEGAHEDAVRYFEHVESRLGDLPNDHAAELCAEIGESYKTLGQKEKAIDALKRSRDLLPDDLSAAERHAALVMETGDYSAAERLFEKLLKQWNERVDVAERVRLTLALGEAQLSGRHTKRAIDTFKSVLEHKAEDAGALEALTRAHEEARNWNDVIHLLQLRASIAQRSGRNDEAFDLNVRVGDIFLDKIRDREAAAQTYVMALDQQPDNRNLLTKLMSIYSDSQDWPRLIEIILRIAEMVKDPQQLAKYYNTAASIAQTQLGRFDEAANYFEAALSYVPAGEGDQQFKGLSQCLSENQDWDRLDRAYEAHIDRLRKAGAESTRIAPLLEARAEVLQHRLGRLADALRYYEEALALEPDNEPRRAALTAIYSKEPKRFFQQAVASHRHYVDLDPYRIESLQSLRKIYTSGKRPDESWCMCQALRCLKMADPDEEKFFKKYRLTKLAKTKQPVTDELWRELVVHPAEDGLLTAIFATLQPAVIATQSQPLQAFGLDERYRIDPINDPTAIVRMLAHVSESTTTYLPPVYDTPHDPGGLSILFSAPPAIGIGAGAKAGGPQQALAFVAARHLCYYRSGHLLRQLVPTGTGLRAWLIAAIRTVVPKFPAPQTMENQVRSGVEAIQAHLGGPQREALRSMTQKLLEAAPELDLKAWMAAVDLTADRLGFIVANDLKLANAVIEASPEDSASVSRKDRLRELLAYSVSEPYFELRRRLGISLGGS